MNNMIMNDVDISARLDAMSAQEKGTSLCHDYFQQSASKDVDEGCRASMVAWCRQVQTALDVHPDTVWIATSFLDRYLSSGKGHSKGALEDRHRFQLAFI
ncbi:hypothetical protein ACHAWF_004997, partial [Thalassiosira exigua]